MAKRRPRGDDESRGALSSEESRMFREHAGSVRPIRRERASRNAPLPASNVAKRKRSSPIPESGTKTTGDTTRPPETAASPSPPGANAENATSPNDDTSIFQQVMTGTRKIRQPERTPPVRPRRPVPRPTRPAQSPREPSPGYEAHADGIGIGSRLTYKAPGIQNREWQKFQRGRHRIEADLDLHGLPSADAERRMMEFIANARERGLRCVCVVHGKGRSSAGGQAVLKKMVDRSLRHCNDVLAFCSSPDHRGGTGAVDVLLRKKADGSQPPHPGT